MKQELEDKLINTFPELYRVHGYSSYDKPHTVGFAVGDGWFQILWNLSEKITTHLKQTYKMSSSLKELSKEEKEYCILHPLGIAITDIKEKYATLRYYYNGGDDVVSALVNEAENLSSVTCETCGQPGIVVGRGWYRTTCYDCCDDELKEDYIKRSKENEEREEAERPETD